MFDHSIEIRLATPVDLPALQDIARQTFTESYAWHNTPENIKLYMDQCFNPTQLKTEMESSGSCFYVMYKEDSLIGYMKINEGINHSGLKDVTSMEIERIYILKLFHGSGTGQALYNKAIDHAKQHHISTIWLGVWEQNPRAIAFYTKNNFETVGTHGFRLGNEDQIDLVMELTILPK